MCAGLMGPCEFLPYCVSRIGGADVGILGMGSVTVKEKLPWALGIPPSETELESESVRVIDCGLHPALCYLSHCCHTGW